MPVHKHAPWRKRLLIPCWIFQFLFEVPSVFASGMMALFASSPMTGGNPAVLLVVVLPLLLSACTCLALTITEIIYLARLKLTPLRFLVMNTAKSILWTGLFGFQISGMFTAPRTIDVWRVLYVVVSFSCFWIPLGYGCVIFIRERTSRMPCKVAGPAYEAVPLATFESDDDYGDYNPVSKKASSGGDVEFDSDSRTAEGGGVGGV